MKRWTVVALLVSATLAHAEPSPAKKELINKVIALQQPDVEFIARNIVQRPAAQIMQAAGNVLQNEVPEAKRDAAGKSIEADVRKFVDESFPVLRDRAVKVAPNTLSPVLDEKFSEDELKQLITWLSSPLSKKLTEATPAMFSGLTQNLLTEAGTLLDPKLQALHDKVQATLKTASADATPPAASKPAPKSGAKPAAK